MDEHALSFLSGEWKRWCHSDTTFAESSLELMRFVATRWFFEYYALLQIPFTICQKSSSEIVSKDRCFFGTRHSTIAKAVVQLLLYSNPETCFTSFLPCSADQQLAIVVSLKHSRSQGSVSLLSLLKIPKYTHDLTLFHS